MWGKEGRVNKENFEKKMAGDCAKYLEAGKIKEMIYECKKECGLDKEQINNDVAVDDRNFLQKAGGAVVGGVTSVGGAVADGAKNVGGAVTDGVSKGVNAVKPSDKPAEENKTTGTTADGKPAEAKPADGEKKEEKKEDKKEEPAAEKKEEKKEEPAAEKKEEEAGETKTAE
jgi:hypothetical protein